MDAELPPNQALALRAITELRAKNAEVYSIPPTPAWVEPIGCTVVRGRQWMWGNEGLGVLGVVLGHEYIKKSGWSHDASWWCWVRWDDNPRLFRYRGGSTDLSIVQTSMREQLPDGVLELEPGVHLLPKGYDAKEDR